MATPNELHLRFAKIQTWLFSIPRLRAMVGANVLLAEVLNKDLPELVRQRGAAWRLALPSGSFPDAHPDDPLAADDHPSLDAGHSITARHGGHFSVELETGSVALAKEISKLLYRKLPGLRFHFEGAATTEQPSTFTSPELPVLEPCKWSGAGLASARAKTGKDEEHASLESCRRQEAARRAEHKETPYASALSLLLRRGATVAETFKQLADGKYLAVVHADGNGVGRAISPQKPSNERAHFYHRNRVAMKVALDQACATVCGESSGSTDQACAPLLPLMLGGDDLLLACRADIALPFIVSLCRHLERWQQEVAPLPEHPAPDFKLTLGIGVIFAPHTLPFSRLHEAAEALAASAKRNASKHQRSIIDWSICTSSWVDKDLFAARRAWVRGTAAEPRLLSRRPMSVLVDERNPTQPSLQDLVEHARELGRGARVARSQLRHVVEQLGRGDALAELAWKELATDTRSALCARGFNEPWGSSSAKAPGLPRFTSMLDLFEVLEIPRLGAAAVQTHPREELGGAT